MDSKMAEGLRMTLGDVDSERAVDKSAFSGGQSYQNVEFPDGKGYTRHGSPLYYSLLHEMAETHHAKSHDYASDRNPFGNYHFAGQLALLFAHSPEDAGFIGRIGEKIFRLANLDGTGKTPKNESIEDTERDIAVIATLWMADRRTRRMAKYNQQLRAQGVDIMSEAKRMVEVEQAKLAQIRTRSEAAAGDIIQLAQHLTPGDMGQMRDYLTSCLEAAARKGVEARLAKG